MDAFEAAERRFAGTRLDRILAALVIVSALRAGVWCIPNITDLSALAQNPFTNPYPGEGQYLFENWLGAFIAWFTGLWTPWRFTLLHAGFSLAFTVLSVGGICKALPEPERRKALCLYAFMPVFWVPWYWVGYDSLTLALMAVVLILLCRPWAALAVGVLVGLQHHQQGLIAFGVLTLVLSPDLARSEPDRRAVLGGAAATVGVLIGHQALKIIMRAHHIRVDLGRGEFLANHAGAILRDNLVLFPTFLYGLLGFGWVVLTRYTLDGSHRRRVALAVLACAVVAGLTGDTTRVFSVISFPVLARLILHDAQWLRVLPARHVVLLGVLWILTPWLYRWGGTYYTTLLPYDVEFLLHAATGWPALPPTESPELSLLPFR